MSEYVTSMQAQSGPMSDWYQIIADIDATAESAEDFANRLREWMISHRIIATEKTDCVLGKDPGHAPGENYVRAAEESDGQLFKTRPNGVTFVAEKTIFYSGGVAEIYLICSACGARFKQNDAWSDALGDWYKSGGTGWLECERCAKRVPITEWQHDPPWAFGYVGVEFWNWPRLRPAFIAEATSLLGHRVRLIYGKV